jgi:hypothetical protein
MSSLMVTLMEALTIIVIIGVVVVLYKRWKRGAK